MRVNKLFWVCAKKGLPKVSKKAIMRLREVEDKGGRIVQRCPMPYCLATVKNMARHLSQVHKITDKSQIQALLMGTDAPKPVVRPKSEKRCPICHSNFKRLDSHLVHKHKFKRGSIRFRELLQSSEADEPSEPDKNVSDVDEASKVKTSGVRELIDLFKIHLTDTSVLSGSSIEVSTRLLADLIKYYFKEGQEDALTGKSLVEVFLSLGSDNSFIRRMGDTLSGSYCCKIIFACKRAVGFLTNRRTAERWFIPQSLGKEANEVLDNLLVKYQKIEKRERATSREKKRREASDKSRN